MTQTSNFITMLTHGFFINTIHFVVTFLQFFAGYLDIQYNEHRILYEGGSKRKGRRYVVENYLIADIGSTTTKVLFIQGNEIRAREEAKTTVEKPEEDVSIGLESATQLISYKLKGKIAEHDLLFSSSAGGGLQIIAIGITKTYTATAAYKLALNSGAIVIDTLALDDDRIPLQRIQCLDQARPDMILFAGGFEGGAINQMVEFAELINLSQIHSKFETGKLPVIYAGNSAAFPFVEEILGDKFAFQTVPNINPNPGVENFAPARQAILDTFITHVMSSAPGYKGLCDRALKPPLPTPVAFERILTSHSKHEKRRIYAFDMGGATTDCYSIAGDITRRSVAANLGMTYSLPFVLQECGIDNIMSALGKDHDEKEVLNFIGNRFIRPVTNSETQHELQIEEALAQNIIAEAYRIHHDSKKTDYDLVIASGGFIAHHPDKDRIKQIITEALHLGPHTNVATDNSFILPHLGVLSQINEPLALELFDKNVTVL